MQWHKEG
jgi:hypothetical protein